MLLLPFRPQYSWYVVFSFSFSFLFPFVCVFVNLQPQSASRLVHALRYIAGKHSPDVFFSFNGAREAVRLLSYLPLCYVKCYIVKPLGILTM